MFHFPTTSPESVGVPSSAITRLIRRLEAKQVPMHSLLLMRHDKLITEAYYAPYRADTLHRLYSVSKSFTAMAISLLAEDGLIGLDDSITDYFPEYVPSNVHPWITGTTIRDMLTMRSCHASTTYKLDMSKNWVESFFTVPPTHPSGTLFHYDTSSSHTLAALVEKLTNMPMLDYLKQKALDAVSFSADSYILKDPFGISMGGSGLMATPMDLLKFAWLLHHDGCVDGKQVFPAAFIREATAHQTDTLVSAACPSEAAGYGYQIWKNQKSGYTCYGMGGQLAIVLPKQNLICVTTADTQDIAGGNQLIYDALYDEVLPYLSDSALAADPEAAAILAAQTATLSVPFVTAAGTAPKAFCSGQSYRLDANAHQFTRVSLVIHPEEDSGELHYTLAGNSYTIPFGINRLVSSVYPGYNTYGAASGGWLPDQTFYIKFQLLDEAIGSIHFQLAFHDHFVTIFMRKREESLFCEYDNLHLHGERILD